MKRKAAPAWLTEYFQAAQDRHRQLVDIVNLSAVGIEAMRIMPSIIKAIESMSPRAGRAAQKAMADEQSALATAEAESGFPTLNGFAVLALWSWLESFIIDFAVLWVQRRPSCLKNAGNTKVRIEVRDLVLLKGNDRARYIVEQIDKDTSGPIRQGNGRFEILLGNLGLAVRLDEADTRTLFEFQQIRNCLAHRFGIVDQRLASACPWLELHPGDSLLVSRNMGMSYASVSARYLLELLYAATDAFKLNIREANENEGAGRTPAPKTNQRRKERRPQP